MAVCVTTVSTECIKAASTHTKGTALELRVVKLHRVGSKAQDNIWFEDPASATVSRTSYANQYARQCIMHRSLACKLNPANVFFTK